MTQFRRDEAVSPVIGVILMVAITVILAAVIAAFVFGMASGVTKTKNVAVTARQVGTTQAVLTWVGGPDNAQVAGWNVTMNPSTGGTVTFNNNNNVVGNSTLITGATSGQDHVVITGYFTDGTQQVLLDTYI